MASSIDTTTDTGSREIWRWLSRLIIVGGIAWVFYIFSRDFSSLRSNFRVESGFWLAYTLLAGAAALLATVPIFRILLRYYGNTSISYTYTARLLFVAQILRHLPGRVWGIVYLVRDTNHNVPPVAMIRANMDIMLYSIAFNLLVAAMLVLGVMINAQVSAVFVIASLGMVTLAIRRGWIGSVIREVLKLLPRAAEKYREALSTNERMPWLAALSITTWYVLVWCLYLSVWWALTRVFPVLEETNVWLLCASYSVAWVAGYVVMITPGGLGVREAGFIAISTKFTTLPTLTFLAVFIRLWQIAIEFILFLAFAFVKPDSENDNATTIGNRT